MIRTIIIDDEPNAIDVLEMQLAQFCTDIHVLAKCDSGMKGIEAIRKHHPDLIFLDIEMPHKSGFDVLTETKDIPYNVIFTTAYDQFAIKAFKYAAMDYLLKPIDIAELQDAVERAKNKSGHLEGLEKKINRLMEQFKPGSSSRIVLPIGDTLHVLGPDDILHCEGDSNYTCIHLSNGKKITTAKTLKEVEATLQGLGFYRIHQSHLVNLKYIQRVFRGEGSFVEMVDGTHLNISRQKKESFLEVFRRL